MLSSASCKISFPPFSDNPRPDQQEEIHQAAIFMDRLSAGVTVFPTSSPFSIMTKPFKPVQVVQALSIRHILHSGDASLSYGGKEGGSSDFSCFEDVRINYLQKDPRPIIAPSDPTSFPPTRRVFPSRNPSNGDHQPDKSRLRVVNPDVPSITLFKANPPIAIQIKQTAKFTCQPPIRRALKVINITSSSSGFFPQNERINERGKENLRAIRPNVRRKPVPKLLVDDATRHSSFMKFSDMDSFPIWRPKDRVGVSAFPLVLPLVRTDVVKSLVFRHVLGQGAQGKVYLAQTCRPYKLFAVKVIPKMTVLNEFPLVLQEQNLLKRVKGNRFLLEIQDSFHDSENFYLITDYHPGGDLNHLLYKLKTFETDMARFYIAELIIAVKFLHDNHIIHRDLKPGNILIKCDGHVCLADLGLCKDWGSESDLFYAGLVKENLGITAAPTTFGFAGTLVYMSPQSIVREPYSYDTDWWAMGVILYELLQGDTPWTGSDVCELAKKIRRDPLTFKPGTQIDEHARDLIGRLLNKRIEDRMQVHTFPQHKFFGQTNFIDVEDGLLTPPYVPRNDGNILAFGKLNDLDKIYVGRAYGNRVDPFPEYNFAYVGNPADSSSNLSLNRMIENVDKLVVRCKHSVMTLKSSSSMQRTITPLSPRPVSHRIFNHSVAGDHEKSSKSSFMHNLPVDTTFGPQRALPASTTSMTHAPLQVSTTSLYSFSELRQRFKLIYGHDINEDAPTEHSLVLPSPAIHSKPELVDSLPEKDKPSVKSDKHLPRTHNIMSQLIPIRASVSPPAPSLLTASSLMYNPNSLFSVNINEANETRTSIASIPSAVDHPDSVCNDNEKETVNEICRGKYKVYAGLYVCMELATHTLLRMYKKIQLGFKYCFRIKIGTS